MALPSDTDIYQLAHVFLREHRETAGDEAVRQADSLLRQGDLDGFTDWWRIAIAVEHIRRMERKAEKSA